MEKYPNEAQSIFDDGHETGNHTYSHNRTVFKTPAFIQSEIERTDKLIRDIGYQGSIYFRPPNGKKLILLPWYLRQHNRCTVMWDIEPNSYPEINADAKKIVDYTVSHTKPGSIILLHPFGNGSRKTREAIPGIVSALQKRGYTFVIISELLAFNEK
jgi:peptidoglycan/xylan/chitin deacetylase (PgdA/CDA1 family)